LSSINKALKFFFELAYAICVKLVNYAVVSTVQFCMTFECCNSIQPLA